MEYPSRSWRPYRRPDDETERITGQRDILTGDDGTSSMFSHTNVGLCISSTNLNYDKQIMEQSLVQLINFGKDP